MLRLLRLGRSLLGFLQRLGQLGALRLTILLQNLGSGFWMLVKEVQGCGAELQPRLDHLPLGLFQHLGQLGILRLTVTL